MTVRSKIQILFLLSALLLWPFAPDVQAVEDTIIAVINDDIITLRDLGEYLRVKYMQLLSEGKKPEEIEDIMRSYETQGVSRLIEDILILDEAKKKGLEVRPQFIEERLTEIKKSYPSEKEFMAALIKDGFTVTDLRNKIKDQLVAKYLIDTEIKDKIVVNPQEVTEYYESHRSDYHKNERFEFESLQIEASSLIENPNPPEDLKNKAQNALELIRSGKSLAQAAQETSASYSLVTMERDKIIPEIEKALTALKPAETSDLIESKNGFSIVHLKAKYPAEMLPLADVKEEISNFLFQQKYRQAMEKWLSELKTKAYIEIKE